MKKLLESLQLLVEAIELKSNGGNMSSFLRTRARVPYVSYRVKGQKKNRTYFLFFFKFEDSKEGSHWSFVDGQYTFIKQETTVPVMEIQSNRLSNFLGELGEITNVQEIESEALLPQEVFSGQHPVGLLIRKEDNLRAKGVVSIDELKRGVDIEIKRLILRMFTDGDDSEVIPSTQVVSAPSSTRPKARSVPVQSVLPVSQPVDDNNLQDFIETEPNNTYSRKDIRKRIGSGSYRFEIFDYDRDQNGRLDLGSEVGHRGAFKNLPNGHYIINAIKNSDGELLDDTKFVVINGNVYWGNLRFKNSEAEAYLNNVFPTQASSQVEPAKADLAQSISQAKPKRLKAEKVIATKPQGKYAKPLDEYDVPLGYYEVLNDFRFRPDGGNRWHINFFEGEMLKSTSTGLQRWSQIHKHFKDIEVPGASAYSLRPSRYAKGEQLKKISLKKFMREIKKLTQSQTEKIMNEPLNEATFNNTTDALEYLESLGRRLVKVEIL